MKNKYSFWAIVAVMLVCIFLVFHYRLPKRPEKVIRSDVVSYYGYLPNLLIYKDISFSYLSDSTLNPIVKKSTYYETTPQGIRVLKTTMGVSLMYMPTFLVAHALAPHLGYVANGYTAPYGWAVFTSALIVILIGLIFLRKLLLKYYSDGICAFTILIVALATNLLQYIVAEAGMSHVFSFCLFSIFMFLIERWYKKPNFWDNVWIGLVFGLITLIRPTNGLVVILFLLWGIIDWKSFKERFWLYLKKIPQLLVIIACVFITWVPQMLYWKIVTGKFFFYSYVANEGFFFNDPKIFNLLFGFRHGWLLYTPIMLVALVGIGFLFKYNRKWFWPVVIFFIINLYIVSSWWCWWYGGAFGMRALIDSYPLMALGFGAFFTWVSERKRIWKITLIVVTCFLTFQSFFHYLQYDKGSIHWDSMNKDAYCKTFWKLRSTQAFKDALRAPDYQAAKKGERGEDKVIEPKPDK